MIKFYSRQSDCAVALAKTKTPPRSISLHKLHHQFARSHIRSVLNLMQQFSSHGAFARLCATAFIRNKPYPLSKQGFYGSPIARRKLRGVPRDGHAMGANHPARNPAKCLVSCPRNFPAMAGQWQQQCRRMAGRMTRKTTCLAPDLAAQCQLRKLARQLTKISSSTMTPKNYEYLTHITDNIRSGIAAQSNSGIPARSKSRSLQQFETVP
jgi:hypothetical protein